MNIEQTVQRARKLIKAKILADIKKAEDIRESFVRCRNEATDRDGREGLNLNIDNCNNHIRALVKELQR